MTKSCAVLAVVLGLALPVAASAQSFGQFTPAPTLPVGGHLAGGYLMSSTNTVSALGQLRLSFYPSVDFGFQGGVVRQSYKDVDYTALRLAADIKYQLLGPGAQHAFSVSVGAGFGVESGDHWNIISAGPSVVASRAFPGGGSVVFTPFVGAGVLFSNINTTPLNESNASLPLRIGTEVQLSPVLSLTGEFQLKVSDAFNDDVGFAVGVNCPF